METATTVVSRFLESKFDQCDDSCGWTAAIIAALAYGTFGVPIKETVSIDVHPMVLQSYKTITMFLMSFLVVPMGESIRFTPWGILSGTLWVLGGTGGIYGIRAAGMAIAVGTWSSIMILVNFLVGIVFFQEPVASFWSTCGAFFCLALGLIGMSIFSAPDSQQQSHSSGDDSDGLLHPKNEPPLSPHHQEESGNVSLSATPERPLVPAAEHPKVVARFASPARSKSSENLGEHNITTNYDPLRDPTTASDGEEGGDGLWRQRDKKEERVYFMDGSVSCTKRQLGIFGAVMNGVLTGSSLVPIHYAKKQGFGGAAYMISFASGALLSNLMIWAVWFATILLLQHRGGNSPISASLTEAYESMPPIHFRQLYIPGFSAGILLAIAMFGSIMSVTYLGQGVGNSIIQSKILISGLWGIFWYREIVGTTKIAKWFFSASLTIGGIMWLSFERIHAKAVAESHL